jgi:hypothetical protein
MPVRPISFLHPQQQYVLQTNFASLLPSYNERCNPILVCIGAVWELLFHEAQVTQEHYIFFKKQIM